MKSKQFFFCAPWTNDYVDLFPLLEGHPIVNDKYYNTLAWGPQKGKGGKYGKSDEEASETKTYRLLLNPFPFRSIRIRWGLIRLRLSFAVDQRIPTGGKNTQLHREHDGSSRSSQCPTPRRQHIQCWKIDCGRALSLLQNVLQGSPTRRFHLISPRLQIQGIYKFIPSLIILLGVCWPIAPFRDCDGGQYFPFVGGQWPLSTIWLFAASKLKAFLTRKPDTLLWTQCCNDVVECLAGISSFELSLRDVCVLSLACRQLFLVGPSGLHGADVGTKIRAVFLMSRFKLCQTVNRKFLTDFLSLFHDSKRSGLFFGMESFCVVCCQQLFTCAFALFLAKSMRVQTHSVRSSNFFVGPKFRLSDRNAGLGQSRLDRKELWWANRFAMTSTEITLQNLQSVLCVKILELKQKLWHSIWTPLRGKSEEAPRTLNLRYDCADVLDVHTSSANSVWNAAWLWLHSGDRNLQQIRPETEFPSYGLHRWGRPRWRGDHISYF